MVQLVRRLVGLLLLVAVAYAGFRWGPLVFPGLERAVGVGGGSTEKGGAVEEPSAELAEEALDRFERLRAGDGDERTAFGGVELSSVLRHSLPGILPPGVRDPAVMLRAGRVRLDARVALDQFPRLPDLDEVISILPDTVDVVIEGVLVAFDDDQMALLVDRLAAANIPIPKRFVPEILAALGRTEQDGLPADALAVPLPGGIRAVFVQGDSLILVARR